MAAELRGGGGRIKRSYQSRPNPKRVESRAAHTPIDAGAAAAVPLACSPSPGPHHSRQGSETYRGIGHCSARPQDHGCNQRRSAPWRRAARRRNQNPMRRHASRLGRRRQLLWRDCGGVTEYPRRDIIGRRRIAIARCHRSSAAAATAAGYESGSRLIAAQQRRNRMGVSGEAGP